MQSSGRYATAALAMILVLGTGSAGSASPPGAGSAAKTNPSGSHEKSARAAEKPSTVTLLTGDRISVHGEKAVSLQRGAGREHIQFQVSRDADHLIVIPQDAVPLLRSGQVDRRLFDVTELMRLGYDDIARDDLPLLLTYRRGADRRSAATGAGTSVTRDLPAINAAAVTAPKERATKVWSSLTSGSAAARIGTAGGVDRIWLDGKRQVSLDHSVAQIGAPAAHAAGWTGLGVTVAVLDTGVDAGHPDLAGRVAEARNFSAAPDARDTVGHGTHVASTIAGSGAASDGRYRGVAPDATLLSGKVCENEGCTESAILAGMQWAAVDKRAEVVNLSLGGWDTPDIDPLEEAVNTLTAQTGTLFVIAAGNSGEWAPVSSPATAESALAVGAVDRDDQLADFSSRGPRTGDDGLKPDVTAPGVAIVAARGDGTNLGEPVGEKYVKLSGTSMATPHAAGAVALLAQQHPDWQAGQLKAAMMGSAKPNPTLTAYEQGAGRIDVARAITQSVTTQPASVSFGRTLWPHGDDEPVTRTVIYRNWGATAVTLDLAVTATGPGGVPAPEGMFRASADQVSVPAGGQAEVTLTADTRVGGPDGHFTGRLVARSGSAMVATPVAVHKEVESYLLTLEQRDRTGQLTDAYASVLVGLDAPRFDDLWDSDGVVEARLPKGRYGLTSLIWTVDEEGNWGDTSMLAQPELVFDGNSRVTVDARQAQPVRMTVPEPTAKPALIDLGANFLTEQAQYGLGLWTDDFSGLTSGQLGESVTGDEFVATISSQWADLDAASSPYLYALSEAVPGRMPNGFVRHYRTADLATVTHEFRNAYSGLAAWRGLFPQLVDYNVGASAVFIPTAVPGRRVEHYNTNGVRWEPEIDFGLLSDEGWPDIQAVLVGESTGYQSGRHYRDVWSSAPFGPSFAAPVWGTAGIGRIGDNLLVSLPVHSDSAGHPGGSRNDSARTALYRDDELIGDYPAAGYGRFRMPAETGNYRLETFARRTVTDLSTEVSAVWTFRSGHVGEDEVTKLPAMAVRFAPKLDEDNAAPGGQIFTIPVRVQSQPGAPAAQVRQLTVDVSYDGGKTWAAALVQAVSSGWIAQVRHPDGGGYVSLRATATDTDGNTVSQRIIQAYRLR